MLFFLINVQSLLICGGYKIKLLNGRVGSSDFCHSMQ